MQAQSGAGKHSRSHCSNHVAKHTQNSCWENEEVQQSREGRAPYGADTHQGGKRGRQGRRCGMSTFPVIPDIGKTEGVLTKAEKGEGTRGEKDGLWREEEENESSLQESAGPKNGCRVSKITTK